MIWHDMTYICIVLYTGMCTYIYTEIPRQHISMFDTRRQGVCKLHLDTYLKMIAFTIMEEQEYCQF